MNDLKSLKLQRDYDPARDGINLLNEFYIPCLSNSIKYDRCAAYFSSQVLKLFSKGLNYFCKNNGHARFIFSCQIDDKDIDTIISSYDEEMNQIANQMDKGLENDYNVANLSYLIKNKIVEIKFAFMIKNKSALYHMKIGEFTDSCGNKIYFDGSGNETVAGILYNAEVFHVFNNFSGDDYYVNEGEKRFEGIWNNTYSPDTIFTSYPNDALFSKLISYNRNKIFDTEEDFFIDKDCVFLDLDLKNNTIILNDYTKEHLLSIPMVIQSYYYNRLSKIGSLFLIDKISLYDIRDKIPEIIKSYNGKIIYSDLAEAYINEQNLNLEQRVKLAESVKSSQNIGLWNNKYEIFKSTINSETSIELKNQQFLNAYHHFVMKSSMDFSVPGTGKTYISFGLFAYLYSNYNKNQDVDHLVVFGPLNCFKAWKDECKAIFGGKHDFLVFDITEHKKNYSTEIKNNKYDIYLFNYDFITEKNINIIADNIIDTKTMIVFDEIHKVKSHTGVHANNLFSIFEKATNKPIYKLALTGTPIPNSYGDLYNYFKLLYKDDLNGFLNNFSENQLKIADHNSSIAQLVQKDMHPLFTRTTKKDLDIPPPNDDDLLSLHVERNNDEEELVRIIMKSYSNPLLKFIRLIQASSNPSLILKKIDCNELNNTCFDSNDLYLFSDDVFIDDESLFLKEKKELIKNIGIASKTQKTIDFVCEKVKKREKIIIWCLFIDTIDLVKNELQKRGIGVVNIDGRMKNTSDREKTIELFKQNDEIFVLITNPNTLAESVSLHKTCHNAIYLEYGFNLTYMLQSKDRIHRVGLPANVETNYFYAIASGDPLVINIDERIYDRLKIKEERMRQAIESDNIIFVENSSDVEDIKFILGLH